MNPFSPDPMLNRGLLTPLLVLLLVGAAFLVPGLLEAQAQATGQPPEGARQMRHFWHVFIAFGIAWLLLFGWAVSIARRLARVEEKLQR